MRAGPEEVIARALFQKHPQGVRIEKHVRQANAEFPFHVPVRGETVLAARVIQIDDIELQAALEEAVAAVQIKGLIAGVGSGELQRAKAQLKAALFMSRE